MRAIWAVDVEKSKLLLNAPQVAHSECVSAVLRGARRESRRSRTVGRHLHGAHEHVHRQCDVIVQTDDGEAVKESNCGSGAGIDAKLKALGDIELHWRQRRPVQVGQRCWPFEAFTHCIRPRRQLHHFQQS